MFKALSIHIVAIILAIVPLRAAAFEYDVDMPPSNDPKTFIIRITINNCSSKFSIKKEEFEQFSKDSTNMQKMVKKAIENASSNCGN